MKFQALGSNYGGRDVVKQFFTIGTSTHSQRLSRRLEQRYGGHAFLFAKGRYALAEAVRMVQETDHDVVAINALTCSVVVDAVSAHSKQLYLDVDPATAHFDAGRFEQALDQNQHIAAVVVQNTYGRMCDIATIESIAKRRGVFIIEDLAHCMGQTYPDGREAGTVGDMVMLSFGRDKLIDVCSGGALIVRNPRLFIAVRPPKDGPSIVDQLRDRIYPALTWLVRSTYDITIGKVVLVGMYRFKFATRSSDGNARSDVRLPHWQARRVLDQLRDYPAALAARQTLMKRYEQLLGNGLVSSGGVIRAALPVENRDETLQQLRELGYELSDTWYDTPIGPARKYARIDYPAAYCPHAVELSKRIINLPTHRYISEEDVKIMSKAVRQS